MANANEGDFESLTQKHLSSLYGMALRMARRREEAEDLVQATLLRGFRFFDKYEQGTSFKAWILKILKNTFINHYRRARKEPDTIDFDSIEDGLERHVDAGYRAERESSKDPERAFLDGVIDDDIEKALSTLLPEYRMVLVMAVVEEMKYKDIAQALGCPMGTVMSRLHRARRLMQARLLDLAQRRRLVSSNGPLVRLFSPRIGCAAAPQRAAS